MSGGSSYGSCCYADCTNSYSTNSNAIFFKFPNDEPRRKKWIANSGNPEVAQLSDRHLRGKRICALHFPDNSFTDPVKKENLTDKAVPKPHVKTKSAEEATPNETPGKRQRGGRQPAAKAETPTTTPASAKTRRGSEAQATQSVQTPATATADEEKKKPITGSCCYAECTKTSSNSSVALFTFPTDETRKKKWITNCGNTELEKLSDRGLKTKRICAEHFADTAFTDANKKDGLTDKAVPLKYTKAKQKSPEPEATPDTTQERQEEAEPVKKAESPQRIQAPSGSESPKRAGRSSARQPAKAPESPTKVTCASEPKITEPKEVVKSSEPESVEPTPTPTKPPTVNRVIPVQSAFGKSLYNLLNGFLFDDEPSIRPIKRPAPKAEPISNTTTENKPPPRLPNGRAVKAEPTEPKEKAPRIHKLPPIRPVGQNKSSRVVEQFVNLSSGVTGAEPGSLIIQNGGEFTLAEGQEYEVIGEADPNDHHIQMVEGDNNEIEIIEVDDQTMAQLTAQNVFFPNVNSGNIQVTELDPNMGQILKVINPSEAYFHQYHQ